MSKSQGLVSVDMTDKLNYKAERFIQRHNLPVSKSGRIPVFVYLSWFFRNLRVIQPEYFTERRRIDYELWRRIVAEQLQNPKLTWVEHFEALIIEWDQQLRK